MAEEGDMMKKSNVHAFLVVIGLLFILIGYSLMMTSDSEISTKDEIAVDYTNCEMVNDRGEPMSCLKNMELTNTNNCDRCYTILTVTKPLVGQVIMYYELTNYEQTSNGYNSSKDDNQLRGNLTASPSESCDPYRFTAKNVTIVPCGEIANTMFFDTFKIEFNYETNAVNVPIIEYGMLSDSDKVGFKNPEKFDTSAYSKPESWPVPINQLDPTHPDNNGFQNERFIGWMRTDWKRKPYGRMSHYGTFKNGLPVGKYRIETNYRHYKHYNGPRKLIFVATQTSVVPGPSPAGAVLVPIGMLTIFIVGLLIYGPRILEVTHKKYDEIMASRANGAVANPTSPPKPNERTQQASPLLRTSRAVTNENKDSAV